MDDLLRFLGVMSALSASAQTMTHQMRKRFGFFKVFKSQGDDEDVDLLTIKEGKIHANLHLVCGINGMLLASMANIHPLSYLGLTPVWALAETPWIVNGMDYLCAGVLVAYGGPWFHEVLGILREYKKSLRGTA